MDRRGAPDGRAATSRSLSRLDAGNGAGRAVGRRRCGFVRADDSPCGAPPLQDEEFCFMHSPEHSEELAEARRLGGLRRRKEKTVSIVYDFDGLDRVAEIRRVLQIAVSDTLHLENSVARARALAYLMRVALRALEVGDLDERLRALEAVVHRRPPAPKGGRR